MQVLGLLVVVLTTTGCLYFMDPNNVASTAGLQAVGTLLMLLNIGFVVLALVLIAVLGASQTKHYTRKAISIVKTGSFHVKGGFSRVMSSFRGGASTSGSSTNMAVTDPGVPSMSMTTAGPSGTMSDVSGAVSMGRGDSMKLFLTAPNSHLHTMPSRSPSQLDEFPSRSSDSETSYPA